MTTWPTWPSSFWSALGTSSSPQLHPVSGTKISPSPRKSHSKLELVPPVCLCYYVCLGTFWKNAEFTSSYFSLSGSISLQGESFQQWDLESEWWNFPQLPQNCILGPRILNNVIFRRSPDLSRIHDPAHGTFCRFLVGFSTSKHMCSCMAWNWSTNMSIKWLRSWHGEFDSNRCESIASPIAQQQQSPNMFTAFLAKCLI